MLSDETLDSMPIVSEDNILSWLRLRSASRPASLSLVIQGRRMPARKKPSRLVDIALSKVSLGLPYIVVISLVVKEHPAFGQNVNALGTPFARLVDRLFGFRELTLKAKNPGSVDQHNFVSGI